MPESGKPLRILLAPVVRNDIREALKWSYRNFGDLAGARYRDLLKQAIRDKAAEPERPGSLRRRDLVRGVWTYHLCFSRDRARTDLGIVGNPRHFLVHRRRADTIEVIRLLHDARELSRHLPEHNRRSQEMPDPDDD